MENLCSNRLLAALSETDRRLIADHGEVVEMPLGTTIFSPFEPRQHVFFPLRGMVSVVMAHDDGQTEIAIIGWDGFFGAEGVGSRIVSPFAVIVQVGTLKAWRLRAEALHNLTIRSLSLQQTPMRYAFASMVQIAETALANARCTLEQRLARWLLMCRDRMDDDSVEVTHDFLAMMVAAQRTGVTGAMHLLEGKGAIRSRRGSVLIRDRAILAEIAGIGYGRAKLAMESSLVPAPANATLAASGLAIAGYNGGAPG